VGFEPTGRNPRIALQFAKLRQMLISLVVLHQARSGKEKQQEAKILSPKWH
jgi:hypothetical protein